MKKGDRVVVISDDEYHGEAGVAVGLRSDGYVEVKLDRSQWAVHFWPHELELESIVKEQGK